MKGLEMYVNDQTSKIGCAVQVTGRCPTVGENLDMRITILKAELQKLEELKAQLSSGASLLDVRLDALSQVMHY